MFTKAEIKQNLMGCFEIVLFMERGIKRFSSTREDAIKSFLVPLFLAPVTLLILVFKSTGYPPVLLFAIHSIQIVLTLVLLLLVVYMLCRQFDRQKYFFQFVNAFNWLTVPMTLMIVPILGGLLLGTHTMDYFYSYAVFTSMLTYIYIGYIATYTLRIPWEMGGFIAILGLGIDQTLLQVVETVRDTLV